MTTSSITHLIQELKEHQKQYTKTLEKLQRIQESINKKFEKIKKINQQINNELSQQVENEESRQQNKNELLKMCKDGKFTGGKITSIQIYNNLGNTVIDEENIFGQVALKKLWIEQCDINKIKHANTKFKFSSQKEDYNNWIEEIGLSFMGMPMNYVIRELVTNCFANNYSITFNIKLKDNSSFTY